MSTKVTEWVLKFRENANPQMERLRKTFETGYDRMKKMERGFSDTRKELGRFDNSLDGLNKKLDELTRKRRITVDTTEFARLGKEIEGVNRQLAHMDNYGKRGGAFSRSNLAQAINQSPVFGGMMPLVTNPYVMGGAALAAGGKFAYTAGMTRFGYNQDFAKINATAQLSPQELAYLRRDVMEMGRGSATDIKTVPGAFERILSATNNVELSKRILSASLKGSQAGFADVTDVASSTVGIMNAVGANKTNANEVLDVLFASKRLGVGEFTDFANYMPSVITQGTALGYNYKDVAGSFSYLTTKGYSADRTNMLLSNAFTALAKPEVLGDLKKYGVKTYDKDKNRLPLFEIFEQLQGKMGGKTQQQRDAMMADIIKDAQAREAFNALVKDTKTLGDMMHQTSKSTGEMQKALDKTANEMNELTKLSNNWESFKDNLGKAVAPALVGVISNLNHLLERGNRESILSEMTPEDRIKELRRAALSDYRSPSKTGQNITRLVQEYGFQGLSYEEMKPLLSELDMQANLKVRKGHKADHMYKYGLTNSPFGNLATTGIAAATDANPSLNSTLDNITGGGGVKNFTVNIGTMKTADTIKVAGTQQEDLGKAEQDFLDMMMRVVQGVELAAGGAQ
jgi:TP901 family phage tail tape measure protein